METYTNVNTTKLEAATKRVHQLKSFYRHLIVYICVNLFLIVSAGISERKGFDEDGIYYPALFWGIGLLCHAISVFAPNVFFGKEWEERKIQDLMEKYFF